MVWTALLPASPFTALARPGIGSLPPEVGQPGYVAAEAGSFESLELSSLWLKPNGSLEEEGRPVWGPMVMTAQGDIGEPAKLQACFQTQTSAGLGGSKYTPDH